MLPFPYSIVSISVSPITNPIPDRRDLVDANNQVQSGRAIDPLTKDYILNANGTFQGQSSVQTSVYLALFTTFGSAAATLGQQLKTIKVITPNVVNQVTNVISQALSSLIIQNLVSLVSCSVLNIGSGNVIVQVNWLDNTVNSIGQLQQTTNNIQQTNLPLNSI